MTNPTDAEALKCFERAKKDFTHIRIVNARPNPIEGWEEVCDLEAGPRDSIGTYHYLSQVRISRAKVLMGLSEQITALESKLEELKNYCGEITCNSIDLESKLKEAVAALEMIAKPDMGGIQGVIIGDMGFTHFAKHIAAEVSQKLKGGA